MKEHADILFLSSNPLNADRLELDREARALQHAIEDVEPLGGAPLKLATSWAAEPLDLLREIRSVHPTVLHFAGYGARGKNTGIYLRDSNGEAALVNGRALQATLEACGSSIRIIVLSACCTEPLITALLEIKTLACVLGIGGSTDEGSTRAFVLSFYQALATGHSIHDSWTRGCAPLVARGLTDRDLPQFRARADVDTQQVFIGQARWPS